MQETNRTEIATLGEFGLIKRLTENIQIQNTESKYGVGDDAAVLDLNIFSKAFDEAKLTKGSYFCSISFLHIFKLCL